MRIYRERRRRRRGGDIVDGKPTEARDFSMKENPRLKKVLTLTGRKVAPEQKIELVGKPTRRELKRSRQRREAVRKARREGQRIARMARF